MKLLARMRGAINGWKLLRNDREVYQAIVRPQDETNQGRYKRAELYALAARYAIPYVYMAAGRNAKAVAANPLRWYTRSRARKAWDTKAVDRDYLKLLRLEAGRYARKAITTADDVDEIVDPLHPALALMESVNPWTNGYELIEALQLDLGLIGNAYWAVIQRNGMGMPTALWPLQGQFVDVLPSSEKFISGYRFGRGYEVEKVYAPEDVVHFKQPNPNDPYYGMGDLAACMDDADLSVFLTQAAMSMLKSGVQPGIMVSGENATEPERKQVEHELNRKHSGSWKWYKTIVMRGKWTFNTLDIGEGATKFLALPSDKVREKIANCFDIPTALLTLDSAALATAKAAIPQWQRMAILPRCRRIEDQINARLVPMFNDPNLFCAFDPAVQDDEDALTVREVSKYGAGITTQNEARGKFRLEPVDGGDEFGGPVAMAEAAAENAPAVEDEKPERDSTAKWKPEPIAARLNGHAKLLSEW